VTAGDEPDDWASLTDTQWRERLSQEQYRILRRGATEPANTGAYVHVHDPGDYLCAGCGAVLFSSAEKFDSGTGWPSFSAAAEAGAVTRRRDWSMIIPRTEVRCARCAGHLGHVFGDGPQPTGQRFCINSGALRLRRRRSAESPQNDASGAS
jgi:peptide-methionine (R)-S-oxide reductase